MSPVFHNRELERLHAADGYTRAQVDAVAAALEAHGTLRLTPLPTGLYPASSASDPGTSGYRHVWVRDNVYVALALWRGGEPEAAVAVARGLLAFYGAHRRRFDVAVAVAGFDARDVMTRPHVRFDGVTLSRNRDGALAPRPERRARLLPLARLGAGVRTALHADRRRDRHAARARRLPRGDPLLGRRGQRPLGGDAQGVGVQHRHGGRRLARLACAAADRARVRTVDGRGARARDGRDGADR